MLLLMLLSLLVVNNGVSMTSDLAKQIEDLGRYILPLIDLVVIARLQHFLKLKVFQATRCHFLSFLHSLIVINVKKVAHSRQDVPVQLDSGLHGKSIEPLFKHGDGVHRQLVALSVAHIQGLQHHILPEVHIICHLPAFQLGVEDADWHMQEQV